jgi:hypothetical protein
MKVVEGKCQLPVLKKKGKIGREKVVDGRRKYGRYPRKI